MESQIKRMKTKMNKVGAVLASTLLAVGVVSCATYAQKEGKLQAQRQEYKGKVKKSEL